MAGATFMYLHFSVGVDLMGGDRAARGADRAFR